MHRAARGLILPIKEICHEGKGESQLTELDQRFSLGGGKGKYLTMKLASVFFFGFVLGVLLMSGLVVVPMYYTMKENREEAIRTVKVAIYAEMEARVWKIQNCSPDGTGTHTGRYHIQRIVHDPACR